ncbi:MAG TPA: YkgJ family cysteine cluster protein [Armatimonadota bacterium]|jgi:hypothetical protein
MPTLITDLPTIYERARAEEDENIRFRQFVKYRLRWSDRKLDAVVLEIVREVTAGIDCTQCGHCCRALEISLNEDDLSRLAAHLGQSLDAVRAEYAAPGTQCAQAFAHSPCALQHENRCTVYPARPRDCREYPHLDKGEFRARMWQILSHAEDCPIVFNTLALMKQRLHAEKTSIA